MWGKLAKWLNEPLNAKGWVVFSALYCAVTIVLVLLLPLIIR